MQKCILKVFNLLKQTDMKPKRKKSMADIATQQARLLKAATTNKREMLILRIESAYRHNLLRYFNPAYGFTDRMYYKPMTRRVYAGY